LVDGCDGFQVNVSFQEDFGFSPLGDCAAYPKRSGVAGGRGVKWANYARQNIIPGQTVTKEKLLRARELRRDMTPAEKLLWQELRANKLGVHFRRQQVIAGFIVDFYCHKAGLVIEVDGDIHDLQQEEDVVWEKALSEMGLRIIRFRNHEVLKNLSEVVEKIKNLVLK